MASLLDRLREIENFPPSHQPVASELGDLLGKVLAFLEFGDELFSAAENDSKARQAGETPTAVDSLVSGAEPQPEPTPTASSSGPAPDEDPQARVERLQQELATAQAVAQRTTIEPVPPPSDAPPPPPAPEV